MIKPFQTFLFLACLVTAQVSALTSAELGTKAATNNPVALREVADALAGGVGVPRDIEAAFGFYRRAADLGDVEATFSAAYMLFKGNGTAVNQTLATKLFADAARKDHPAANFWMGIISNEGSPADKNASMKWLARARQLNAPGASDYLGQFLLDEPATAVSLAALLDLATNPRDLSKDVQQQILSSDYLSILGDEDAVYLQQSRTTAGFDTKGFDGKIGPNSKEALAAYRVSRGRSSEGVLSILDLKDLGFF